MNNLDIRRTLTPAVLIGDDISRGMNHSAALTRYGLYDPDDVTKVFITEDGKQLNREEAMVYGKEHRLLNKIAGDRQDLQTWMLLASSLGDCDS
jgi:hypothetical protein